MLLFYTFAAFLSVGESVHNPLVYYDNNVAKARILLERMIAHHCTRFVFSSVVQSMKSALSSFN